MPNFKVWKNAFRRKANKEKLRNYPSCKSPPFPAEHGENNQDSEEETEEDSEGEYNREEDEEEFGTPSYHPYFAKAMRQANR